MGIIDFFKKETKSSERITSSDDEQMMYTPDVVNSLASNEIFVFGSNLRGWHQGGAAKHAMRYFGAVWGKGSDCKDNPMLFLQCKVAWIQ